MTHIAKPRFRAFLLAAAASLTLAACNDSSSTSTKAPDAKPASQTEATVPVAELNKPGDLPDQILGKADAPLTIIEYASMTCGHCANFHNESMAHLKEKYINTGKVRFIFREFPLDPVAYAASLLTRCSGDDKFYPVLELLFRQQRNWAVSDKTEAALFDTIKQTGMTQDQFNACLQDQTIYAKMQKERQRASQQFGVDSTPTFFFNGRIERGAMTPAQLDQKIEGYLKAAQK